jgi:serine/threonine-protein kinase
LSEDEDLTARILREARVTAAIDSPYVVKILNFGRLPGAGYYLVLEHLKGSDLATLVKRRGVLDVAHSLEIAMQLCDAIGAAHQLGVIHRDIKPHNVIATSMTPLSIKLLDFGISKATSEFDQSSTSTTAAGVMLGTPNYMAPEQIHQLEPTGPSTDIYAIGATLHFLLTGRPPFEGTSLPRVLLQICDAPLAPLKQLPEVTRVLARALAKEPHDRFPSAGALRKALAACAKPRGVRESQRAHA